MNRIDAFRQIANVFSLDPEKVVKFPLYNPLPTAKKVMNEVFNKLLFDPQSINLVVGGIGSGKSTMLWDLYYQMADMQNYQGYYIDFFPYPNNKEILLKEYIALCLCKQMGIDISRILIENDVLYLEPIINLIRDKVAANPDVHHVILLDGFDKIEKFGYYWDEIKLIKDWGMGAVVIRSITSSYQYPIPESTDVNFISNLDYLDPGKQEDKLFLLNFLEKRLVCADDVNFCANAEIIINYSGGIIKVLNLIMQGLVQENYCSSSSDFYLCSKDINSVLRNLQIVCKSKISQIQKSYLETFDRTKKFNLENIDKAELLNGGMVIKRGDRYILHPILTWIDRNAIYTQVN